MRDKKTGLVDDLDDLKAFAEAMRPGELTVISGASGVGKTTLALRISQELVGPGEANKEANAKHKGELEKIQDVACRKFGVTREDLLSNKRSDALTDARQLAMYVARKCTTLSLPAIAESFNRTHVAVIVGVKQCEKRLSRESRETVREILKEFGYDINDVMA